MGSGKTRSFTTNNFTVGAQRKPTTDYETSSRVINHPEYTDTADIEVMTASDVAKLLKVSTWSVYEMAKRNEIPHFNVGRSVRFVKLEVLRWMLS